MLILLVSFQDTSPNEALVPAPSGPEHTDGEEIEREIAYPDGKVKWEHGTWNSVRPLLWKMNGYLNVMAKYWSLHSIR